MLPNRKRNADSEAKKSQENQPDGSDRNDRKTMQ
jgi:hypothetical protein